MRKEKYILINKKSKIKPKNKINYKKEPPLKIISFSFWGNDIRFFEGAVENAILTKRIYGGEWTPRFYCDDKIPSEWVEKLKSLDSQVIICKEAKGAWEGLFWRFYPASDKDVEVVISRDIDSRLNSREKYAVNEWLASDKCFHIMRDHPMHDVPILGGMWGAKRGCIPEMRSLIEMWTSFDHKGCDQEFLASHIYNRVRDGSVIHDEIVGPQYNWDEPTRKKWPKHPQIEWGKHVGDYIFEKVVT